MLIICCDVGEDAKLGFIYGGLVSMQELVGGYIEAIPLTERLSLVCNEEGKIQGLKPNRILIIDGKEIDVICGNFFIVGNGKEDFRGLMSEDVEVVHEMMVGKHSKIFLKKM